MDVLVVDDDEMTRGLVARFVSRAGHRVIGEAEDGIAALEMLGNVAPDVVVTDCQMPRLDGIGMVRKIRESGREVRVVMLSGQTDQAVIDAALRAGVDAYLVKPMDPMELVSALGAGAMKPAA
jgi:DNA-binding response OmpR family regulator